MPAIQPTTTTNDDDAPDAPDAPDASVYIKHLLRAYDWRTVRRFLPS